MPKSNQTVTWPTNANVAPASVRKESDVMTQGATAYDANAELAITANGGGAEVGYQVDFYSQYTNVSGVFEATPPIERLVHIGSINVNAATFPLRLSARNFDPLPLEYRIVAFSTATTDTVTVDVVVRTNAP